MKAAIYARVSTRDKGQEVENQLRELREYCARSGYELYKEYIDHESGSKADRPSFKALFADAHQKKFNVVLFFALDRLSREGARQTINYLCTLEDLGISFISYTEPYLNSAGIFREALISILATLAKQEKLRISERVRAGLETARARGKKLGNQALPPIDIQHIIKNYEKLRHNTGKEPSVSEVAAAAKRPKSTTGKILKKYKDGQIGDNGLPIIKSQI